jgi:adenylate cyclase
VLFSFITGKYHRPRETERIFMFVDLRNSTRLAESLGDIQYHRLLNNFFWDITTCVVQGKGEIYRYVGDQVVIAWKPEKGLHEARCIRTYYSIREELSRQAPKYLRRYGVEPAFRASCHIGMVVAGEIGNVKSQIVYIGDTLYIAGEIEKKCRTLDSDFIVSEALVHRLPPQRGLFFQPLGRLPVEGRENGIALLTPVVA